MCGETRQDKIINKNIRESFGVAPIMKKIVKNRLRWFEHPIDFVVRRVEHMEKRQTIRDENI